jgi:hypothetical protein
MPLAADVTLDSTTWGALALVLTIIGGALTWVAWRRRGVTAGLRGLAWTLVPIAAWLTGTLKLAGNIVDDVLDWAARLVFSPTVWLGIIVAGVAVALFVVSGLLRSRGIGVRRRPEKAPAGETRQVTAPKTERATRRKPANDDIEDLDDIEAILKRHGI